MNRGLLRRFPSTSVAIAIAVAILLASILWHIRVFQVPRLAALGIEPDQAAAIAFACLLVVFAFFLDRAATRRRWDEAQVHAQHELAAQAARRLAAIVESSDDAIIGKDLNSIVTSWNHSAEQLFGYSAAEMVGTSIVRVIPADRQDEENAILDKIKRGESLEPFETKRQTKDGRLIDVSVSASPIKDAAGHVVGAAKVARDISRRKHAESQLRESEARLTFALEKSHTGGWDLDLVNQTAHRSLEHDRIFGYESLLPEWTYEMFLEHVLPDDRAEVDRLFQQAISTGTDWSFECRIRRADGEVRWIWAAGGHQREADGPAQRMAGIVQDITERKQAVEALRMAEERTRFALLNANVGIWDMDYLTGVLRWSGALEAHYGLQPGTFGGTFAAFIERIHPDDRTYVLATVQNATKSGADFTLEHRAIWPDGTVRWLSGAGRILLDDRGEPVRGVGVSMDVTDRRTLEAQYLQAQKMEAIGQLAGGVAHDFNNLLTAILGYCELLLEDFAADDAHHADLVEIQRAGARAAGLTRQLLAFSRKQIIEPALLDMNVVISDLNPMLRRLIRENVKLVLGLASARPIVLADRGQVEQVVINLAVNAQDAMPAGGVLTIETANIELDDDYVATHYEVKAGRYVVLTVTDTGSGMTPEVQAHLFEPFFTTKETGKGTGLGLATVHGIVKRSGGNVTAYSELGKGTSFKVYFPRADAAAVDAETPAAIGRAPRARTETVLVVDDASELRELARRLLQRQGYTVLVATNAQEAVDLFEHHAIDVLLTDVVMPGASGPELTEQLLARRPTLKVLYMSGYTEETIVHHGVLKPGIAFLHKPFTSDTLGRKILEVLDK